MSLATELIKFFQEAVGKTQGLLERQLADFEGDTTDYRMKRGLAYILKSGFCTFEIVSPLEPPMLRAKVFALAAKSVASQESTDMILNKIADNLTQELNQEVLPAQIKNGLYADLSENKIPLLILLNQKKFYIVIIYLKSREFSIKLVN